MNAIQFLQKDFNAALTSITVELTFSEDWNNGTGYFDGAVLVQLAPGQVAKSMCPKTERKLILVGTAVGTVVVFERYKPNGNNSFVLTYNAPHALTTFIGQAELDAVAFGLIVTHYHVEENIGTHLAKLYRSLQVHERAAARRAEKALTEQSVVSTKVEKDLSGEDAPSDFGVTLAAVKAVDGKVLDDHTDGKQTCNLVGLAVLRKKGKADIPVGLCGSTGFCLNEVYVDEEGRAHISRRSVGGIIILKTGVVSQDNLKQAIAEYNEAQETDRFSCGTVVEVNLF